jgi:anti-sigma-K factor RskA
MLAVVALALVALFVMTVAVARKRRTARGPALSVELHAPRAGVNHLAARVSEMSDVGFHLRVPAMPRRRLGALLSLR